MRHKEKKDKIKKSEPGNETQEFLKDIRKELDLAVESDRHNRRDAVDCLNFSMGGVAQWDDIEVQRRKRRKRIIISLNQCPKYIKQLTGEMRQNRATVKVHPADSVATKELALVRQGLINDIFYQSDFETIQDNAAKQLVTGGYGAWRVLAKYDDDNPFRQVIYIEEIDNPLMAFMDPRSRDFLYRDAKYGYVLSKIGKDDFEDEYPNATLPGEELRNATTPGGAYEKWYDTNGAVTIAERYAVVSHKKTLCLMSTGEVFTEEDANRAIKEWEKKYKPLQKIQTLLAAGGTPGGTPPMPGQPPSPPPAASPIPPGPGPVGPAGAPAPNNIASPGGLSPGSVPQGGSNVPPMGALPAPPMMPPINIPLKPEILDKKDWDVPEIRYWKLTGHEILEGGLEGKKVSFKWIPICLVRGEKLNIEGRTYIKGLINDVRDAQRLLNWWETNAAEHIAMMPKAPWVGTTEQFKGFEKYYAQSNEENYPIMVYNVDPETPNTKPTREGMPQPPIAVFAQIDRAEKNVRTSFGMSGADLGEMDQMSGRASGTAIGARQKPSEATTFVFKDNIDKMIMHTGRIIESAFPVIYDTERDVRLRAVDGTSSFMPINTTLRAALTKVQKEPNRYPDLDIKGLTETLARTGDGEAPFNDMSKGKYDTVIKVGPNYATQKAESADILLKLYNSNPKQMGLVTDLILKNTDILDSEEASERLEKTLPPGMLKPKAGKPPAPPMPPPPQAMIAQGKLQVEMGKLEVQKMRLQTEKIKTMKALQGEKGEMRKMMLELLREVMAPEQPQGGMQ